MNNACLREIKLVRNILASDALLLDFYACPSAPQRWVGALDRLSHEMGARSAVVQTFQMCGSQLRMHWSVQDSSTRSIGLRSKVEDERNPRLNMDRMLRGLNRIARDEDLFDREDGARHQLQQQLASLGLGRFIGSLQQIDHGTYLALALHRGVHDQEDFSTDQVDRLSTLVPHLGQAVELCGRMQDATQLAMRLQRHMDHLRCGLIIADAQGNVQWLNRSAEQRLAGSGVLKMRGEQLFASSSDATLNLLKQIANAAGAGDVVAAGRYLTLGQGAQRLHLALQPLVPSDGYTGGSSSVLIVVTEVGQGESIPTAALVSMYGLTPAESRLVDALIGGYTLEQYAQHRGISLGTVRGQLKLVLSKTGATRQSELVRMVLTSAAAQLADPRSRAQRTLN
jgi:DNA-binding CsgD family transcriptional regulator/PAS domain-containing protein